MNFKNANLYALGTAIAYFLMAALLVSLSDAFISSAITPFDHTELEHLSGPWFYLALSSFVVFAIVRPQYAKMLQSNQINFEDLEANDERLDNVRKESFKRILILGGTLAVALGITAAQFLHAQSENMNEVQWRHLASIAQQKSRQIQTWKTTHINILRTILADESLLETLANKTEPLTEAQLNRLRSRMSAIQEAQGYIGVVMENSHRSLLVGTAKKGAEDCDKDAMSLAISTKEPQFSKFYLSDYKTEMPARIDLAVFLPEANLNFCLRIDPYRQLFPMLERWPTPSLSGEFLLVRIENNDVVYLHGGKRTIEALERKSLEDHYIHSLIETAAESINTNTTDYRSEPVVLSAQRIPNSPWYLIAKIDQSEANEPSSQVLYLTLFLTLIAVLVIGVMAYILWRFLNNQLKLNVVEAKMRTQIRFQHFYHAVSSSDDLIILTDSQLNIIEANNAAKSFFGNESLSKGHNLGEIITAIGLRSLIQESPRKTPVEVDVTREDAKVISVELSWHDFSVKSIKFIHFTIRDISDRKQREASILHKAEHDALTDLLNRSAFLAILQVRLANRLKQTIAFIDLDGFKPINDQWGHRSGDEVLRAVAQNLEKSLRQNDVIARVGGDEFAVLMAPETTDRDTTPIETKMLEAIESPLMIDGVSLSVSASIGFASSPADGRDGESLLDAADKKMYEKKAQRKSRTGKTAET